MRLVPLRLLLTLLVALAAGIPARAQLGDLQLRTLDGISRDRFTTRWIDLNTNELATVRRRAEGYLDALRDHHLVGGQLVSVRFSDTNQTRVERYENLDDSTTLTGLLLTVHALRFSITRDDRESIHGNPSQPAIRQILDALDLVTRAAGSGHEGYLPRFVGRANDPAYIPYYSTYGGPDPARPGLGRLAYRSTNAASPMMWLGGPTRDAYAAVNLGLASTWQQIRDPSIRSRASNIVCRLLNRIIDDGWQLNDGQGHVTFVTPALAAALLRTGATIRPDLYGRLFEQRAPQLLGQPATGMVRYGDGHSSLFNTINLFALSRLETNQSRKIQYQDRISQQWHESSPQLNPLLAACYVGAFEKAPNDPAALAVLQGAISQFPNPPRWSMYRDGSEATNRPTVLVNGEVWSRYALPFDLRPVAPFQWSQSPYLLRGGVDAPVAHSGVDYLLAFWMGRESGLILPEDALTIAATPTRVNRPTRTFNRTNSFLSNTNRALRPRL